ATVLTTKLVAHVDPQTFHARRLAPFANVDVHAASNNRRHGKLRSRRAQHAIAVKLLDSDRVFESHDDRSRNTDGAERLVSLVQQQYSSIECHYPAPPFMCFFGIFMCFLWLKE